MGARAVPWVEDFLAPGKTGWAYAGKRQHYFYIGRSLCGHHWVVQLNPDLKINSNGLCPEEEKLRECGSCRRILLESKAQENLRTKLEKKERAKQYGT